MPVRGDGPPSGPFFALFWFDMEAETCFGVPGMDVGRTDAAFCPSVTPTGWCFYRYRKVRGIGNSTAG